MPTDQTTSAPESTRPVGLLADSPADEDAFAGHAHATIAEAIADLIRNETGGRVIGLEGTWGSGKSTIVHLTKTVLEDNARPATVDYRVCLFDAWA